MKTLTEFAAPFIKNAAKIKAELVATGKSVEELPAAIGEALKVEGDRLNHLVNALNTVGDHFKDLRRVLVQSVAEGEKEPSGAQKHGEHHYVVENHPAQMSQRPPREERDDRGGKRGGRDGKRGGGGRPGSDDKRGGGGGRGPGGPGGDRSAGGPGGAGRGPRPGAAAAAPAGPRVLPKPRDVSGSAPTPASTAAPAADAAPKSE